MDRMSIPFVSKKLILIRGFVTKPTSEVTISLTGRRESDLRPILFPTKLVGDFVTYSIRRYIEVYDME